MSSRIWTCHERSCKKPLATIVNGELVLQLNNENVACVNTDGAFVNIQCACCGRINRWVPKDSALTRAFLGTHLMKELFGQVARMWTGAQRDMDNEQAEREEE